MTPAPETSFAAQPKQDSRLPEQSAIVVIRPDFTRTIDLPGAGPCPRPVDIDQARSGFSQLVSLRIYSFAKDVVIDGKAEDDEVFIALMRGAADFRIESEGRSPAAFSLDTHGGARAIYMPPHAGYRLTAASDCDIAYARSRPAGPVSADARAFAPDGDQLNVVDHAEGMELTLAMLSAGETLAMRESHECFVHIRGGAATVTGTSLQDWDTALLDSDGHTAIEVEEGTVDVLAIGATALTSDAGRRD